MFQVLPQGQRRRNELNKVIDFAELVVFSGVRLRVRVKGRVGEETYRESDIRIKPFAHNGSWFFVLSVRRLRGRLRSCRMGRFGNWEQEP